MTDVGQNKVPLDWVFTTDVEWKSVTTEVFPQLPAPAKKRTFLSRWKYMGGGVAVIACTLYALFVLLDREADLAIAQVQDEIQGVVATESKAWSLNDEMLMRGLLDEQAPLEWVLALRRTQHQQQFNAGVAARQPLATVQQIEVRGDYVMADVFVTPSNFSWLPASYRETRFYRESEAGWLRTVPRLEFWGPRAELRTDHFVFHFHRRDRNSVISAASALDARYLSLRQELALPAPSNTASVVIDIRVDMPPNWDLFLSAKPSLHCIPPLIDTDAEREQAEWCLSLTSIGSTTPVIALPSPALLPAPQDADEAEALIASIDFRLASLLLDEKRQQSSILSQWLTLHEGLRLALAWGPVLPRPLWFHEVETAFCQHLLYGPPLRLSDVGASMRYRRDWLGMLAARTVAEYMIQAHGRQIIPELMKGVSKHDSWQTLLPDVLDIDASNFERGWQAYLSGYPLCAGPLGNSQFKSHR